MFSRFWSSSFVVLASVWFVVSAGAQHPLPACGAPPVVAATAQPNIFSEQQEEWLGDAMADWMESSYRPAQDPAQSAYLQAIADKLAATIPGTHIHFRVQVIDSSVVNGFSLAGGYIYIMRKLAASAQNDDELASVIGHEMGHIASHQFAFETTANLRRLLGITQVGDKADIAAKFQQLVDAEMHDKHPSAGGDTDEKQDEADRIGVYVTAAAGYRPQAFGEFWDRLFFTQGKTGGKFQDFFGISKPDERRLGRIRKLAATLPPGCVAPAPVMSASFAEWHRLFSSSLQSKDVKNRLKTNGTLAGQVAGLKQKESGRLIEVVNAGTGAVEAEMVLERPPDYAGVDGVNRVGDLLYVTGEDNRTLVYTLRDGKQQRQMYGALIAADPKGRRVCVQNRVDEAIVYDESGKELTHVHMDSPIRFASFTGGGSKLMLLAADQVIRTVDATQPQVEQASK